MKYKGKQPLDDKNSNDSDISFIFNIYYILYFIYFFYIIIIIYIFWRDVWSGNRSEKSRYSI